MEDQRQQRIADVGQHVAQRRRGLLMLVGIGLLLLVLGTAHICTSRSSEMNQAGGYSGRATIVGGPAGKDPSNHVEMVSANTKGIETCVPGGDETDWDFGWVHWALSKRPLLEVNAPGSGGYATGFWDCIFFHSIEWRSDWSWLEDGEEDSGFAIDFEEL